MKMLLMLSALLCGTQNATAAFIDSGSFLTDTTSELDWLDVTSSVNRSYNDVSSQFGIGGDFDGWRYATGIEFDDLISHWTGGLTVAGYPYREHPEDGGSIDGLSEILGSTIDAAYINMTGKTWDAFYRYSEGTMMDYTFGTLADKHELYNGHYTAMIMDEDGQSPGIDFTAAHFSANGDSERDFVFGSFLVREALIIEQSIPEPASIALFGLGLSGLGFSRRKVKTNSLS